MRNLSLAASQLASIPNANLTGTAIDLDQNVLYTASERANADGEVEIEIWQVPQARTDDPSEKVLPPSLLTMFTSITSSAYPTVSQITSFRIIPDSHKIAAITRFGDITMIALDDDEPVPEVEGTVESGILAAAWSPDDSLLALVTGEHKLILMTSEFDVLSEAPLDPTDFGEDAPINVGWGSKQTQFHGSLGKAAAQAPTKAIVGHSPDDDTIPRISWRGDGAFFVVSSLSSQNGSALKHRVLRVYDRQAALQSTSEPVAGLEHALSWRPSGNLIVGTQRFGFEGGGAGKAGRHDVVFFERNGLRHGEFGVRVGDLGVENREADQEDGGMKWGYKVKDVRWSSDSNVLALWIERNGGDIVQLWTIGNYHWYLKQEIAAPPAPSHGGHFTSVEWHPEHALRLILTTPSEVMQRTYGWETISSPSKPPNDSGSVAVFDGSDILLTPFRTQNVPPPMSAHQISLTKSAASLPAYASRIAVHVGFSVESDLVAVLWETGYFEIWSLCTRLAPGRGKAMEPVTLSSHLTTEDSSLRYRQILLTEGKSSTTAILLGSRGGATDVVCIVTFEGSEATKSAVVDMPQRNGRLVASDDDSITWQALDGALFSVDSLESTVSQISSFTAFCFTSQAVTVPDANTKLYVGLTESGKLYATSPTASSRAIVSNATSFTIASGFLIYTTSAHDATFAPLVSLPPLLIERPDETQAPMPTDWEKRRVERGSKIVVAVPSSMSLVLQMPRGNLETINPRPLVMAVVRQDLDAGNYRKAFIACRKHRIDLNVLVDHDQEAFLQNLDSFVEQVHEVDYINLFLTSVGRDSQSPETVSKLCESIRAKLEEKDLTKYVNTILTAHIVTTPPEYEAGLSLLLRLREDNAHLVEDAVKYIIFLVDADKLFDTALGMYDFMLVLMIAQHAQKDPREYLPFLRELRALDKYYQRFRIDDHLRRHESALRNLSLAGDVYFEEAVAYVEQHQLYEPALSTYQGTDHYNAILIIYGEWLFERREFRQAATAFVEAGALSKAMVAHEKALNWQDLFEIAIRTDVPEEEVVAMGYRAAEDLTSKKRYAEAARVLLDYSQDVREAVATLVQGNAFSEARRIMTLNRSPDLLAGVIYPGALESRTQIADDLNEMQEQLRKQLGRLQELRVRKIEEPDAFYGVEDTTLHNVDVMTDVSMPATAFTRYTIAPSSASRKSKQTSRSKRKMERKVGSGRKGTVDEEEYLLKSVTKLVGRFTATQDEARNLLPHMFGFTPEHRAEGLSLQKELTEFEVELREAVEWIWTKPSEDTVDGGPPQDSWASRMEEIEKKKQVNPIDQVPKPVLEAGKDWRVKLLDMEV